MKWRDCGYGRWEASIGPYTFRVEPDSPVWYVGYFLQAHYTGVGTYRTERQAKTYAYRRAKALVERMAREVRDA